MSRIVLFHNTLSTREEEYLFRLPNGEFTAVKDPDRSNLEFETKAEAYEFASHFPRLQYWRVGVR